MRRFWPGWQKNTPGRWWARIGRAWPIGGTTPASCRWDLLTIVRARLQAATAVLDVDTGDGRRSADALAESGFRGRASATECYAPNVPLAPATLTPLGVKVRESRGVHHPSFAERDGDDGRLPFDDGSFDLVLNRHGSLDAAGSRRVLRPDSWLVTQQVGSKTNLDIHYLLDASLPSEPTWDLATARAQLEDAGLRVRRAQEAFFITRYDDVRALVRYLKAIPWQIPDFSVDRYADKLLAVHRQVEQTRTPIDIGFHLFLLVTQA